MTAMERDNFYLLLELSLEPPETNDEVIWEAIQKKKAEWSRLRNHPTKGVQAQKYISMIPEIQRIMMYNDFRQKEAIDAIQIIKKGKADKYVEIDRHIDTFLGKGFIEDEEVAKLAQIHNIDEQEIRSRIDLKLEKKMDQVDQEISIRMAKGYLAETDLKKIADRHSITVDQVRGRIRCPIAKNDKEKIAPPKPLEKSIEKGIIDNLRIINKTSLYDFLGMPSMSDLKMLQEKASLKKNELSNLSKKDADVTAGNILAGHCLTIFKNDESRYAYDVSLANARLAPLYTDIDMAVIEGKIRNEYFDVLVQKTMAFGMDDDEASQFIQTYCKEKDYQIEKKEKPSATQSIKPVPKKIAVGVAALVIVILAGVFFFIYLKGSASSEYQAILEKAEKQSSLEEKAKLLKQYLNSHKQNTKFAKDAAARIEQIEAQVVEAEFKKVNQTAEKSIQDGNLDQAVSIYQEYVKTKLPETKKNQVAGIIKQLTEQIEKKDFEEVNAINLKGEPDQKIAAFQAYLTKHPSSPHKAEIENFKKEMSGEYYIFVKNKLASCEENQDWKGCVDLCQGFINLYDNSNSDQLKQLLPSYQEKVRNDVIFQTLMEKANQLGNNYPAAQQIYKDYLSAYPNSPVKPKIQAEMAKLTELAALEAVEAEKTKMRNLLAGSGGRFVEKKNGVISDSRTGLMWCLVDAKAAKPKTCMNYEESKKYVEELATAGYKDWRLPTPAELSAIYKSNPSFPSLAADERFWTSESFTSYSDGWHIKVSAFGKENQGQWEIFQIDSKECGNVRAVRKE